MKVGKQVKKQGTIFFCSLVSSVALLSNAVIPNVEDEMSPFLRFITKIRLALPERGLLGLVVFGGLWLAYRHYFTLRQKDKLPRSKAFLALALLYALLAVVGMSVKEFDSLAFLLKNKFQAFYSAVLFLGFAAFFHMMLGLALYYLSDPPKCVYARGKLAAWLDRHPIALPMCVLLACWLPYWIVQLPAVVVYDMNNQLGQFFGYRTWTNHHPALGTLIYGAIMQVGRTLHSDNLGFFLCALYQELLFAASITFGLRALKRWEVPERFRVATLLFFALLPVFPLWAHTLLKDSTYFCLSLIFGVLFVDLIRALKAQQKIGKLLYAMVLWGVAASLVRQNGTYVVVASLFAAVLACRSRRQRVQVAMGGLAAVILVSVLSSCLMGLFGIEKAASSVALSLSVPFQQTARYVKEYPYDVTPEEREAIDGVLNYEELAQRYDPDLSDQVKNTYRGDNTKLAGYMKAWFQMFWKHPVVYIEATLSNTYGYFYPNAEAMVEPIIFQNISKIPTAEISGHHILPTLGMRSALRQGTYALKAVPGIGLLLHIGTYTWILLFLTAWALYRRRYDLLLGCVPSYMGLLSCMVSPVNGSFRYFLPNIYIMPFLLGWFIVESSSKRRVEVTKK